MVSIDKTLKVKTNVYMNIHPNQEIKLIFHPWKRPKKNDGVLAMCPEPYRIAPNVERTPSRYPRVFFPPRKWVAGTKNAKNCGVFFSVEPMKTLLNRMCWQDMSFSVCSPVRSVEECDTLGEVETARISGPICSPWAWSKISQYTDLGN